MGNMANYLEDWKKECYVLSSPLNIRTQLQRKNIDDIYKIFIEYFGIEYFKRESEENNIKLNSNWLHSLLVNHRHPACIAAIYETANILIYLKTLDSSIQRKFRTLFKDPRQFRDLFFEIFVFRLLDFNHIQNIKKPKEGNKELDIVCILNEKEYLCECKKLYVPKITLLNTEIFILELLYLKLGCINKGFGFIGTIKIYNPNDKKTREIFEKKINNFFLNFNEKTFHKIDYHDIDANGELSIIDYNTINNIETENKESQYDIIFKVIPPSNPIQGIPNTYHFDLKANFNLSQKNVINKLFNSLKDKKEQHKNSKYANKIYFIDNETSPGFEWPCFLGDSLFNEFEINDRLTMFSENEIFCFIKRNYLGEIPSISIKAFGNNICPNIKHRLENLNLISDFKIMIIDN